MYAGSYGIIKDCLFRNQDMPIHQQAVLGARFFDLDTRHGSGGRLHVVRGVATGDELSVVINQSNLQNQSLTIFPIGAFNT